MNPKPSNQSARGEATGDDSVSKKPRTPARKGGPLSGGLGIFIVIVLLGTAAYLTIHTLTTAEPPTFERLEAVFMCVESSKTFSYAMDEGERWPVLSPYSNKRTGYPAEPCFWTKVGTDWKRKTPPSYTVLNEHLGKAGDTFCPDCGRLVIGHNPRPPADVPLVESTATIAPAGPSP